jgi:hypothetical protein
MVKINDDDLNNRIVYNNIGVENIKDMSPKQYMDSLLVSERKIRISAIYQIEGSAFADGKSFGNFTTVIINQNHTDRRYWILLLIDNVLNKMYNYSYLMYANSWTEI